jgi:hypothetical protein
MNGTLAIVVWASGRPKPPARTPRRRPPEPQPSWLDYRVLRDPVLFIVGLLGVGHETLIALEPRWSLLLIFGAMMGLPPVLRADEARRNGGDG